MSVPWAIAKHQQRPLSHLSCHSRAPQASRSRTAPQSYDRVTASVHRPRRSAARSSFRRGSDLGWVMRHAVQAPPAKRAITQGQRRRRGSPLMTRSRCRRRLASAGSPSKWSSSAMTIILTGGTGARTRWARGWKSHRDRDCNGCRARRGPAPVASSCV